MLVVSLKYLGVKLTLETMRALMKSVLESNLRTEAFHSYGHSSFLEYQTGEF